MRKRKSAKGSLQKLDKLFSHDAEEFKHRLKDIVKNVVNEWELGKSIVDSQGLFLEDQMLGEKDEDEKKSGDVTFDAYKDSMKINNDGSAKDQPDDLDKRNSDVDSKQKTDNDSENNDEEKDSNRDFGKQKASVGVEEYKLDPTIVKLLHQRISDEYVAHQFYRNAGNWCALNGFFKAQGWCNAEAEEELKHAKKLQNFLTSYNVECRITYTNLSQEFTTLLDVLEKAYKLELELYNIYDRDSRVISQIDLRVFDYLEYFRKVQQNSISELSDMLSMLTGINLDNKFELLLAESMLFN